jgi:hypothetical protein
MTLATRCCLAPNPNAHRKARGLQRVKVGAVLKTVISWRVQAKNCRYSSVGSRTQVFKVTQQMLRYEIRPSPLGTGRVCHHERSSAYIVLPTIAATAWQSNALDPGRVINFKDEVREPSSMSASFGRVANNKCRHWFAGLPDDSAPTRHSYRLPTVLLLKSKSLPRLGTYSNLEPM